MSFYKLETIKQTAQMDNSNNPNQPNNPFVNPSTPPTPPSSNGMGPIDSQPSAAPPDMGISSAFPPSQPQPAPAATITPPASQPSSQFAQPSSPFSSPTSATPPQPFNPSPPAADSSFFAPTPSNPVAADITPQTAAPSDINATGAPPVDQPMAAQPAPQLPIPSEPSVSQAVPAQPPDISSILNQLSSTPPANSEPAWPAPAQPQAMPDTQPVGDLPNTSAPAATEPTPYAALDNPFNMPPQSTAGGDSQQPTPTWTGGFATPTDTQPPETPITLPVEQPSPLTSNQSPQNADAVPTDLSHLINISPQVETAAQPSVTQAETLVVPTSNPNPEVPIVSTEGSHGGIPKWIIGVGIGLLLVVAGASAYFILGLGQAPKPSSVPATQKTTQVKTPVATAAPTPQASQPATATGSASFGKLGGSATPKPATSAAELLKQRQGR